MSVTRRIVTSWRNPRGVMRDILSAGPREDRALATLIGACLIIFIAQWPAAARAAHFDPEIPLEARLGGLLMGTMFLVPLFAYLFAGIVHVVAKVLGGQGSFYTARMSLFWSLLAVSPLMLFHGLIAGFVGPGPGSTLVGGLVMGGFLYQWVNTLIVAEGRVTSESEAG